jgi:S-adenosylmethionine-diacylglycerol 3-amino-3-carboxypropyl transferase
MAKDKHLEEVNHTYIRYANVWEDPILLIEGLDIRPEHKVLSIASAGDNALALLGQNPASVVAIDLNRGQLYLTELKKVSMAHLEHKQFISFLGFTKQENRWETYISLRGYLSGEAKVYWNAKEDDISKGVIHTGKFERYLKTFAKRLLPLIHRKTTIEEMFREKTAEEQAIFYNKKWNTWRWKALFRFFFNKQVMGLFGRDRAFLKQVEVHVSKTIFAKAGEHLASVHAQKNPFLYFCLTGRYGNLLPYYAKPENYEKIKANLDHLEIDYGYAQDAAIKYGKFDRFNLSNIYEYMDPEVFQITSQSMLECATPGARFAYWNLMVERKMSSTVHGLEQVIDSENWAERDKGFFYMKFVLDKFVR